MTIFARSRKVSRLLEEQRSLRDRRALLRGTSVNDGQMADFALRVHAGLETCT